MSFIRKTLVISAVSFFLLFLSGGCGEIGTWKEQEESQIKDFLESLGDTTYVLKSSGLYYMEITQGTGEFPVTGDSVTFYYKGMFLDKVVFDTNITDSVPWKYVIGSGTIIAGIDEGLRYMRQGGKSLLLTPSNLAYGHNGYPGVIPGYTPLLWEITLLTVKKN